MGTVEKDYVMICLDSCKYDSFVQAETPNFDKIGEAKPAYSPAGFTIPSLTAYFLNMPPYNINKSNMIDGITVDGWIFKDLKIAGYRTAIVTANPWVHRHRSFLGRYVDHFENVRWDHEWAAEEITDECIKLLQMNDKPLMLFVLYMATHLPYRAGPDHFSHKGQVGATASVDKEFGRMLPHIHNTELTIFADHGDLVHADGAELGVPNRKCGHHPGVVPWDERLYKIPFIRKYIK